MENEIERTRIRKNGEGRRKTPAMTTNCQLLGSLCLAKKKIVSELQRVTKAAHPPTNTHESFVKTCSLCVWAGNCACTGVCAFFFCQQIISNFKLIKVLRNGKSLLSDFVRGK